MEDVLDVYQRPYDKNRPQVCIDEFSRQLLSDVAEPLLPRPGQSARQDHKYKREGTVSPFMIVEPLQGIRQVVVRKQRRAIDYAHVMKYLADDLYPEAEVIVIVQDNLNTHSPASFYKAFAPSEARRLAQRFEWHYTPKKGSWLNIAEIEINALSRQCLKRRLPDQDTFNQEVQAWVTLRNSDDVKVQWHFTTDDARLKLKHLYPKLHKL